ncbi:hypothetical protein [Chloroflexus sp.]
MANLQLNHREGTTGWLIEQDHVGVAGKPVTEPSRRPNPSVSL